VQPAVRRQQTEREPIACRRPPAPGLRTTDVMTPESKPHNASESPPRNDRPSIQGLTSSPRPNAAEALAGRIAARRTASPRLARTPPTLEDAFVVDHRVKIVHATGSERRGRRASTGIRSPKSVLKQSTPKVLQPPKVAAYHRQAAGFVKSTMAMPGCQRSVCQTRVRLLDEVALQLSFLEQSRPLSDVRVDPDADL